MQVSIYLYSFKLAVSFVSSYSVALTQENVSTKETKQMLSCINLALYTEIAYRTNFAFETIFLFYF